MEKLRYQLDMSEASSWEFVSAGSFAREKLLYMQEVGLFDSGPAYFTERESLSSYLIKLTLSGQGILEYCGEKQTLRPGSIFWIDCSVHQRYYTDPAEGRWEVLWVHFSGATAEAYYQAFRRESDTGAVGVLTAPGRAERILRELLSIGRAHVLSQDRDIRVSCLLTELLAECINGRSGEKEKLRRPDYVVRVKEYLDEFYARKLPLAVLAREVNVSPYHLQRRFKEYYGLSPADYLGMVRMNRAKELLRGTELPVGEVAAAVGVDESYFIACFRKSEGVTPAEFRRIWRGEESGLRKAARQKLT